MQSNLNTLIYIFMSDTIFVKYNVFMNTFLICVLTTVRRIIYTLPGHIIEREKRIKIHIDFEYA